jgi:hypothetical protein
MTNEYQKALDLLAGAQANLNRAFAIIASLCDEVSAFNAGKVNADPAPPPPPPPEPVDS